MSEIDRRTVSELLTEHQKRMGRSGDTNYTARSKEFLSAAHLYVATTWWHPDLDEVTEGLSFSVGSAEVDISGLSPRLFIPGTVQLLAWADGEFVKTLEPRRAQALFSSRLKQNGTPSFYARWRDKLIVNVPCEKAFGLRMYYYARPRSLDDDATDAKYLEGLEQEWDEAVLVRSLVMGHRALWAVELATAKDQEFQALIAAHPNPLLREVYQYDKPTVSGAPDGHGGARGA